MKKGATRKPSGEKSSKPRSLPALSDAEVPKSTGKRFSFPERPLARHDSPLGQLVPIQYDEVLQGLATAVQWVSRAAGFPQRQGAKTEAKMSDWRTDGYNPASVGICSHNVLRKPVPGFPLNCAFYRLAPLFNSAAVEDGTGPCWDECECCKDEVDLPGKAGNCFDMRVSVPTTPSELLQTSEGWQKELEQLDLVAPLPSGKTNWAAIREVHELLKVILTILEAKVNEVSSKYELYSTSTNLNGDEEDYPEDCNEIDLYEALRQSFDAVSSAGIEHCLQALNLITNCLAESQEITDYVSAFLLPTAMDLVDIYNRTKRVQEILVLNKERTIDLTERNSEEERAFGCSCRLIEAVSCYVISIQNHVLHSDLMQQDRAEALKEQTPILECLRQSWIWLSKLNKQVTVLCPNMKQKLFVYLLETSIDATGELSQHQKLLPVLYDENCKEHMATACSCQKILLHFLMQLFKNAEKAGLKFRKDGFVAAFNFAEIAEASRIHSVTLTLLLSLIADQGGTNILESQHFSETLRMYREELLYFAKPCMAVIEHLAVKNASRTNAITESTGDVIEGQDNLDTELLVPVGLGAELVSTDELLVVANDDNEAQAHESSTSANSEEATQAVQTSISALSGRQRRATAFGNRSVHVVTESPDDALEPEDNDPSASNTISSPQVVDASSTGPDNSLDRQLPDMLSVSRFDRVNVNAMTVSTELVEGSSGQVSLVIFDNTYVALKKSLFPDPIKARKRLEREAKVHQRINSHSNILRFLGRAIQLDDAGRDQIVGIITEWCEFGNLSEAIGKAASIQECLRKKEDISEMKEGVGYQLYTDWIKRLEVVSGIAAGMVYMHHHHIVHRDLTSANVLLDNVDKTGRIGVKVCDFERGFYINGGESIQRTRAPANSTPWMGPEVLKHEKYDLKADVYSIGTILWELMYLENPWTHLETRLGASKLAIQWNLSKNKIGLSISKDDAPNGILEFPELVQLVRRAWARDPHDRPTMAEFYKKIVEICDRMKDRVSAERIET